MEFKYYYTLQHPGHCIACITIRLKYQDLNVHKMHTCQAIYTAVQLTQPKADGKCSDYMVVLIEY